MGTEDGPEVGCLLQEYVAHDGLHLLTIGRSVDVSKRSELAEEVCDGYVITVGEGPGMVARLLVVSHMAVCGEVTGAVRLVRDRAGTDEAAGWRRQDSGNGAVGLVDQNGGSCGWGN